MEEDLKLRSLSTSPIFEDLPEDQLAMLAHTSRTLDLRAGQSVFRPGEPASAAYLILRGSVRLSAEDRAGPRDLALLGAGDVFGIESFSGEARYFTGARAEEDLSLLALAAATLKSLGRHSPAWSQRSHALTESLDTLFSLRLPWLREGEHPYLALHQHTLFLWVKLIPLWAIGLFLASLALMLFFTIRGLPLVVLILGLLLLVIVIGGTFWLVTVWRNGLALVTNQRVISLERMVPFYDNFRDVPLDAVLSVERATTVWGRSFGYGDLGVKTYTGNLRLRRVPYVEEVQRLLNALVARSRQQRSVQQEVTMEQRLRAVLGGGDVRAAVAAAHRVEVPAAPQESSFVASRLAQLFGLRRVESGAVIYRTHWWILLKRLSLPLLLLLAAIALDVLGILGLLPALGTAALFGLILVAGLAGGGWAFYNYLDWNYDTYVVTDDQLMDINRKPLGSESRRTAPIKNIQSVDYERRGLLALLLDYGTVSILVGEDKFTFDDVYQPAAVQQEIFRRYLGYLNKSQETQQQQFLEWLQAYDRMQRKPPPPQGQAQA